MPIFTSIGLASLAVVAAGAGTAMAVSQQKSAASDAKNAGQAAEQQSQAAIAESSKQNAASIAAYKEANAAASTKAGETIAAKTRARARAGSTSIYTSPLGLGGQASVAKKTLLGQ